MNKKIFVTLATLTLTSASSFAGSGDASVAATSGPMSMAGAGTALFMNEFDATAENPALLTESKKEVGDFVFHALIRTNFLDLRRNNGVSSTMYRNDFRIITLPSIGLFYKSSEKLSFSAGTFMLAANGDDYKGVPELNRAESSFAAIRFNLSAAYKINDMFSVGGGPVIYYTEGKANSELPGQARTNDRGGSDVTFGFQLGGLAKLTPTDHVGVNFLRGSTPKIQNYTDFGALSGVPDGSAGTLAVGLPDDWSFGYTKFLMDGRLAITSEYRFINWSNAAFYKDLGWNDSHVFALGGQYTMNEKLKLRAGISYGKFPLENKSGTNGDTMVKLGNHSVPRWFVDNINNGGHNILETRLGTGATYQLRPNLDLIFAYMYELPNKRKYSGTATPLGGAYNFKSKAEAHNVDLAVNYSF